MEPDWDCIVVGGGAAGLSAALVLGRARRRTLVVDAGRQSNRPAHGMGGLLGWDGRPPADLYAAGRAGLAAYPSVEVRDGEVAGGRREDGGLVLDLAHGRRETTHRVLLATGMDYGAPTLPGVAERWGRSVFHCPFCHGWEVHGRPLGVLGGDAAGLHRALLLRMWSEDVVLFTDGPAEHGPADAERLATAGVAVDERRVARVRGDGDHLEAVVFADGSERAVEGLLVAAPMRQRSRLAAELGASAGPGHAGAVDPVEVQNGAAPGAPGVFVAGDLTGEMPSVANAIASGSRAAAAVVQSLMAEGRFAPARP